MSSGTLKRELGDDPPCAVDNGTKRSKENEQVPHETDSFCFVDDVITDLRSIECYVGQVKSDDFRKVLDKLEKSSTLVRKNQGQDDPDHRIIHKDDILELRRLVDKHCANTGCAKLEKLIKKIISDDELLRRQTNHREVSKRVSENVHRQRYEPLQQELHSLQAVEQSAPTIRVEDEVIEMKPDMQIVSKRVSENVHRQPLAVIVDHQRHEPLQQELQSSQAIELPASTISVKDEVIDRKPDTQNLRAGGEGFVASFFETVEPHPVEVSNQLKNIALINFNAELLKQLSQSEADKAAVQEVRYMIEQRTRLVTNAQYIYSLMDQLQFNQELLIKLRGLHQICTAVQKVSVMLQSQSIDLGQHCPFNVPFFRYLTDFDLLKCIANNIDSVAAQHIIRARKLSLSSLSFESKLGIMQLKLNSSTIWDVSAGVRGCIYRQFQYGMKINNVEAMHVFGLFNIILHFYDISKASTSITLRSDGSNSESYYQLLESSFGSPPSDRNGNIRTKQIILESPEMVDFLRWFCPNRLVIDCDPDVLEISISGVNLVECKTMNVDRFMENCNNEVLIQCKATWGEESIRRVLTAHRLSADGCRRKITCRCPKTGTGINTVQGWRKLFESWSHTFEAEHGNIGRMVTISDNNFDRVTLTLY